MLLCRVWLRRWTSRSSVGTSDERACATGGGFSMPQAAPTSMGYHSCDCIEEGFNIQQTGIEGDRMSASDVSSVPIVTNQSHPSSQISACTDPESSAAPSRARRWPFRGFPATQRETRGSPALCVSGSFQGNQRVFGAPFCFSRVSLGKLASFPESESWSGAKSGAKLRKSARYPGIFQVYRGFPGIPAKYPVFCRFWPQNSLRHGSEPPQNDEFHGVSPGFPEETRGCCRETSRKHGKETR